jgi:hypothetical protein
VFSMLPALCDNFRFVVMMQGLFHLESRRALKLRRKRASLILRMSMTLSAFVVCIRCPHRCVGCAHCCCCTVAVGWGSSALRSGRTPSALLHG